MYYHNNIQHYVVLGIRTLLKVYYCKHSDVLMIQSPLLVNKNMSTKDHVNVVNMYMDSEIYSTTSSTLRTKTTVLKKYFQKCF